MTRTWVGATLCAAVLGCNSSGTSPSGPGDHLTLVSGNGQAVPAGAAAGAPLIVHVTGPGGASVAGLLLTWSVVSGRGVVSGAAATDSAGNGSATFTADTLAGGVKIRVKGSQADSVDFALNTIAGPPAKLVRASGDQQNACRASALPLPLGVRATDQYGNPTAGPWIHWALAGGDGALSADSTRANAQGVATVALTLGAADSQRVTATGTFAALPVTFTALSRRCFTVLGGGNNEGARYTSDLWLTRGYGYTGTWGYRTQPGNVIDVWKLNGSGAPTLAKQVTVANGIQVVSDLQASPDSSLLIATGEYGSETGLYLYSLADPADPTFLARWLITGSSTQGLHTGTVAEVNGQLYVFTARDPAAPSLLTFRIQPDSTNKIVLVDSIAMPANYGIHDTYVRDGILIVCNWDSGLWFYDIGGGGKGGSPDSAVFISSVVTQGGEVHNAWWFHNPVANQKKYVFVGQEGPGTVGSASAGDIHVVDVSDLSAPVEVAHYHLDGAGTHNFWMDEANQVLYAAYYNGGVVALDVSGTLSGDLASRKIAQSLPGGPGNTYVWGVMLYGGRLYAADMVSGLWELGVP